MSYRPTWSGRIDRSEEVESGDAPWPGGCGGRFRQGVGACQSYKEARKHLERPGARTSRPGRLAAVSASAWACRRSSRLTCAPLFCALVIPNALFTMVLRSGSSVSTSCSVRRTPGGHCRTCPAPMPTQPLSVATKAASARWRKNHRICRAPSQWPFIIGANDRCYHLPPGCYS